MNTITASEQAYDNIRRMLTNGKLKPGQRVSQSDLARKIGCSTVPIVEAMRRLESEGLLVKQPRKMARVRKLSPADFEGLYLLREGVESVTVRLCTERMTEEQVQKLVELAQTFEEVWEEERLAAETDIKIHRHIAECAGCPFLVEELDRLRVLEFTAGRPTPHGRRPDSSNIHRALVEAIVDRDADSAEYIMKKHIRRGYQELLEQLGESTRRSLTS